MNNIQANDIGSIAKQVLTKETRVKVSGKTSRGLFLRTSDRWILFISFETFRNPLTINIPSTPQLLEHAQGTIIKVSGQRLVFPNSTAEIDFANAALWHPPAVPPTKNAVSQEKILTALMHINEPLLKIILSAHKPEPTLAPLEKNISQICAALPYKAHLQIAELASSLLGLGGGLTPEGDDFITGLFFALYTNQANHLPDWKRLLFEHTAEIAYQKTTTISANLIECAQNGQTDERLACAYHAIKFNHTDLPKAVKDLSGWGNTSGKMALAGISAGVLYDS